MNDVPQKTKPSPSPWRVTGEYENGRLDHWKIIDSDDLQIAIVPRFASVYIDCPTQEANAEFIALACNAHNNLLVACKAALPILEYHHRHGDDPNNGIDAYAIVRAAIAKAESISQSD